MIIKHTRRMDFSTLPALHIHCRIEIDCKLQLQAIVHTGQIKPGRSTLIINDSDIYISLLSADIHTIDPSLKSHAFIL